MKLMCGKCHETFETNSTLDYSSLSTALGGTILCPKCWSLKTYNPAAEFDAADEEAQREDAKGT